MGHSPGDGLDPGVDGIQPGDGEHQPLGVGVAHGAVGKDKPGAGLFHHLPTVHNGHIVRHLVDDAQVMCDKDDGGAVLLLELIHQAEDLGLDGHVQGGGGLVGNEDLGPAGQSHGDHHPLAHSAGQLVGVLVEHRLGVGDLHRAEHLQALFRRLLLVHALVDHKGLGQLALDGEHRVQAGHGLLEDDGNGVAPDVVHIVHGQLGQVPALKEDLPRVDIAVGVQQAQDAHGGHGLARAGLAHNADGLARLQAVGHVVHCLDGAVPGPEIGVEVLDLKEHIRHYFSTSDFGSSTSRRVSPMVLMQMTTMDRNRAGNSQRHQ